MSALRRASGDRGTAASAGFVSSRVCAASAGIGLISGIHVPTGFAVDLERVLAAVPRRAMSVEPRLPPHTRRTHGRWPSSPFRLRSAGRVWSRDRGRRR